MIYQKAFFKKNIITDVLLIAVFCSIFTYWFFRDLDKQGLYSDVALVGNAALLVKNNASDYNGSVALNFLGKKIPLMLNSYNAATDIYAAMPWVYIYGNKPIALHIPGFIWGLLAVIVMYPLCLRLFNSRLCSVLASLMLAASPTFIIAGRIGLYTGNLTMFFSLLSVFLLFLWQEKKKKIWLFLIGLSLGIGLSGKIQFLWFINAFLIYIAITEKTKRDFFILKNIFVFITGMIIGALSFILGNITGHFLSFSFFGKYAFISRSGVHNFNYFVNFTERFNETISLINSAALRSLAEYPNYLGAYIFYAGAVLAIGSAACRFIKKKSEKDNSLLPILLFIFIIMQSPFTMTYFDVHHMIVLLPFMCMVAVFPVHIMIESSAGKALRLFGAGVLLFLILFIGHNYRLFMVYNAYRNIHSGAELKWNTLPDVINFLNDEKIKDIGLGDTGLNDSILFLTNFSLRTEEVFYAPYKSIPRQRQEEMLINRLNREKEGYYLFRPEEDAWIKYYPDFQRVVLACGKNIKLFKEFQAPEGRVIYRLYKVY